MSFILTKVAFPEENPLNANTFYYLTMTYDKVLILPLLPLLSVFSFKRAELQPLPYCVVQNHVCSMLCFWLLFSFKSLSSGLSSQYFFFCNHVHGKPSLPRKRATSIAAGILHANETCFEYTAAFNSICIALHAALGFINLWGLGRLLCISRFWHCYSSGV